MCPFSYQALMALKNLSHLANLSDLVEPMFPQASINFVILHKSSWDIWCKMDFTAYPVDTQVGYEQISFNESFQEFNNSILY